MTIHKGEVSAPGSETQRVYLLLCRILTVVCWVYDIPSIP